nr:probable cytochrome P450 305a1 [Bombus vancouverensis nearcticus]
MFATVLLAIVTLILLIIYLVVGQHTRKTPPGPFSWPIFGNQFLMKRLIREFGGQHEAFLELSKRYASDVISVTMGNEKVLVISGSKLCETVLKNEEFDGRPWNEFIKLRNMGKKQGITMNDGGEWKELRSWMLRTMRVFGFGKREMAQMIRKELTLLLNEMNTEGPHKLRPLITPTVINVLWFLTTGESFSRGERIESFIKLMETRAQVFDMMGGLISAFPWIRYIAPEFSGYNLLCTLNKELKDFLMGTIIEHKKKYKPGTEADVIDMFLHEMKNHGESSPIFTDDQLVVLLIDLFLAGFTTTSLTLDFLLLTMTVYQDVQHKVQKEIDSVIPRDRLPEVEDKAKLPYVEAVISEVQRMWPVFPIIGPRRVLHDTILDKYTVPRDTTILVNMYSINKDPNIYPEPHKFMPERFIRNDVFEPDTYSLQFGKGRRRCPGEVLAKSALFILFTGIMQKYNLRPVPGKGPNSVEIIYGLTSSPKPYEVLVTPRY